MKKLITALALGLLVVGCATNRKVFNTLYTVEHTTDSAIQSYYTLVIQKKIPTNSVPRISHEYTVYQVAFRNALVVAQFDTNSLAPANVIGLSALVVEDINTVKGLLK